MSTKRSKERARAAIQEDKPVNWDHLHQRFTSLTYRRTPILDGLVAGGVIVEARSPEEAVAATEHTLIEETLKNPES